MVSIVITDDTTMIPGSWWWPGSIGVQHNDWNKMLAFQKDVVIPIVLGVFGFL